MLIGKMPVWSVKLFEYVFYILFLSFPFVNYTSYLYFGSSTRSVNIILFSTLFCLILGFVLLSRMNSLKVVGSKIQLALVAYLATIFLSAILGSSFSSSFFSSVTRTTGMWFLLSLFFLGLLLIKILESEETRRRLIYCISLSTAIFSFLSLLGKDGFNILFRSVTYDGFTFGNSTFAGMYILGAFLLSVGLWFDGKLKAWKPILSLLIILNPFIFNFGNTESQGVLSFLGLARASAASVIGSILLLGIGFAVSKIKNTLIKKRISYTLAGLAFISVVAVGFSLVSSDGYLRKLYLMQASGARPLVWEVSRNIISQKPLLGFGPENFEKSFELNYNNRILESQYGSESWFDRAHNIFIDTLLENGVIGLIFYFLVYVISAYVLLKVIFSEAKKENKVYAFVILTYLLFHIVELQTAFDTSISYLILAFMLALAISLERITTEGKEKTFSYPLQATVAICVFIWGFVSFFFWLVPLMRSEPINLEIREVGSAEKRLPLYDTLFNTPVDLQAVLWNTVLDFQRGIAGNPKILEDEERVKDLHSELVRFEEEYKKYVDKHPTNFRALLNYANVEIYFMLFGENKLADAHLLLDKAIELVPNAPQPYHMKAVAYLYSRDFPKAREYAKKALELNPNIVESQRIVQYIDESIKNFPEIDLYFFKQI